MRKKKMKMFIHFYSNSRIKEKSEEPESESLATSLQEGMRQVRNMFIGI